MSRKSFNVVANCLQCFEAIYNECAAVHLIRCILPFSFNEIISNNASEHFLGILVIFSDWKLSEVHF